jgi:hypothetical protein
MVRELERVKLVIKVSVKYTFSKVSVTNAVILCWSSYDLLIIWS